MRSDSPRQSSRTVRILFRCFVALVWIVVLLTGIEAYSRWVSWRVANHNPMVLEEREILSFWDNVTEDGVWAVKYYSYQPDSELTVEAPDGLYNVKINRYGWRSPEVEVPKPDDVYRIVCVGGSTTVEGWTNETTYPGLLQAELNRIFPEQRIEVVNAGVSGLNSEKQLQRTSDYLRMDPDLILHYNVVNDIVQLHYPRWTREAPRSRKLMSRSKFLETHFNQFLNPASIFEQYLQQETLANRSALVSRARTVGVEMAVASFVAPDPLRLDDTERSFFTHNAQTMFQLEHMTIETYSMIVNSYNRLLARFCEQEGVTYLPVAENFPLDPNPFVDICHMNEDGIRSKARVIAEQLRPILEKRFGPDE